MLAQDTQCVQSLCTGRYDALYVQRYRQTTGKCDAENFNSLYPLNWWDFMRNWELCFFGMNSFVEFTIRLNAIANKLYKRNFRLSS